MLRYAATRLQWGERDVNVLNDHRLPNNLSAGAPVPFMNKMCIEEMLPHLLIKSEAVEWMPMKLPGVFSKALCRNGYGIELVCELRIPKHAKAK